GQSSGACLIAEENGTSQACMGENRFWSTDHCEDNVFKEPLMESFTFYSLLYSISLEILPWIMNSQMYPTEVRGIYGGIAAAANWIFSLIVIMLSFSLTHSAGPLFIFLLISLLSFFVLWFIESFVTENIEILDVSWKNESC
ncbi:hypothetical protein MKW92_048604, partial [Papaver armeniacum]